MKRIIYTFFIGLVCSFAVSGQQYDLILNTPESGNQVHQALNSITFGNGYSYTPAGGEMLAQIVWQAVSGYASYSNTIDPAAYEINTSLGVGKLPGNLNISGTVNYNIPIEIPEAINGMQPSISLNYSNNFNDGILGTGWNLSGISAITRVNKTIYHDGMSDAVRGDLTDKYELDGKRMVIYIGTYGTDGSEYRTEMEEGSRIIAQGSTGKGPESFTVYAKSGLIYEYGYTTDSKLSNDTCILVWKVNKIKDRYNNYITFNYLATDDELPITMIEYTGNSPANQSPFARILFNYKNKSYITRYVYGGK